MKKFLVLLIALFTFSISVKAECLDKEYIDWSYDLKPVFTLFNYNEHPELDMDRYKYAYFLSLSKKRDDITFNVIDKFNNTIPAENFEELGIYGAGLYNGLEAETYKIEVYGNAKGTCNGELITTLEYTVPPFNEYYKTRYCDDNKEHKYCQVFTYDTQNVTQEEFEKEMTDYEKEKNKKNGPLIKIWRFILSIKLYLLCIIVPIVGVSIYYNVKIKKYRKMKNRAEVKRAKRKTYLFVLLFLLLTVRVNASGVCGDVHIDEGRITSAGWATRLVMCDFYDTGKSTVFSPGGNKAVDGMTTGNLSGIGGFKNMGDAIKAGEALVAQTVMAADGKSASTIMVPMCIVEDNGGPGKKWTLATSTCTCEEPALCWDKDEKKYVACGMKDVDCSPAPVLEEGEIECPACPADAKSSSCTKEYYITCPIYACSPVEKTIEGWCTPTFSIGNDSAYCINPSDAFPARSGNNYQTQPFDATKCEKSFTPQDCGFANILIEAEYYSNTHTDKINYQTRNMALRLWSAQIRLGGFYRVGLAYMMGYDCNTYVAYPAEGHVNVYIETLRYITKKYFELLSLREYEDHSVEKLIESKVFDDIGCLPGQLGVVCTGQNNEYKKAFALYFNTLLGNNEMQNHLANLYGDRTTEPISSTVAPSITSEEIERKSVIEVKYREEVTIGERVDCTTIKDKKKGGATLTEKEQKIYDYCSNQITHVIGVRPDGRVFDVATGIEIIDSNNDGNYQDEFLKLPDPKEPFDFSYCQKNSCFSPVTYFALCDEKETEETVYETIYVTVRYTQSSSRYSVKKYLACGSGDYQIMWSYDDDEQPGESWEKTTREVQKPIKTLTSEFYCYDDTGCSDYSIRTSNQCAKNSGDYGTVEVKDPSLRCIVNMQSSLSKKSYDYSDVFGVNTDFCRIYCSDSAEFYLADKVDIYSGLSFKLDIEYKAFGSNKIAQPISSVVRMKRDCVSRINYNFNFESGIDWTKRYDGLEGTTIKNWKDLYNNLNAYGKSKAHINQIKYDLMNCNLYSEKAMSDAGVYKPNDNKIGNVYKRITEMYSESNSYGFNGDKYGYNYGVKLNKEGVNTQSDNNTVVDAYVKYDAGAFKTDASERVGTSYNDIRMGYVVTNHNKNGKIVSDVKYCSNKKDSNGNIVDCFAYDRANPKDEYQTPEDKGFTDTASKTTMGKESDKKPIPTNDYAYFTIANDIGFYNSSEYQIEPYTGNVKDITNGGEQTGYLKLDKYVYPVSSDAKAYCGEKSSSGGCKIYHKITVQNTYYRIMGKGTSAFKEALSQVEDTCPTTYITPPVETKTETVFRNVDISNMFPTTNSDGSRRMGGNWENSTAYIEEIENYVNTNGIGKYYETHLEYSYTLTGDAIDKIKEYNKGKPYTNNSIDTSTCVVDGKHSFNCKSNFITDINSDTNLFGITNNRFGEERGVSDYTRESRNNGKTN